MTKTRKEGTIFIDRIYEWFGRRSKLWISVSLLTLASIITMQVFIIFLTGINHQIRQEIAPLLIPLLLLFVFSIFWRGSIQTFLSLAGTISVYAGMFYVYARASGLETLPPVITNKLGVGRIAASSSTEGVANFYFFIGMLALILCVIISLKPSLFRAKGTQVRSSYPVWSSKEDRKMELGTNIVILVPVAGLLSPTERYLVAKYKYIVVMIGRTIYFVSPEDWVPEGSIVIRDKESGSLLGIPKVGDGFNVW
jgi:hypothetical protein